MKKLVLLSLFLSPLFLLYSQTHAEVPQMMNYQGKLATAHGGCLNDTVRMTFSIYPDSFGTTVDWTETQSSVVVKEGIFSVLLGSVDSIPTSLFDGGVKYLGVQVESDPEMRPLKPMVSVPYAYRAVTADGSGANCGWVDDGAVVRLEDGFLGNASLFKYARDLGNPRGDMYEIAVWEETIVFSGDDIMFAINIPQEAVVIPETMDGIRACLEMQKDRLEAVGLTNKHLGMQ